MRPAGTVALDAISCHFAFKRVALPSRQGSSCATNGGPDFASEEPRRLHSLKSEMGARDKDQWQIDRNTFSEICVPVQRRPLRPLRNSLLRIDASA